MRRCDSEQTAPVKKMHLTAIMPQTSTVAAAPQRSAEEYAGDQVDAIAKGIHPVGRRIPRRTRRWGRKRTSTVNHSVVDVLEPAGG
jgi:hypothetical protein